MRLDLLQLVEHHFRQFVLLKIEEPIVSQDEAPAAFSSAPSLFGPVSVPALAI